jgi:chaperone modulatory protein CbpM
MVENIEVSGDLLADDMELSLADICAACGIDAGWLEEMMAHGAIAQASVSSITRIRKARRLEQDFELNPAGIALALDLLDEIERIRAELARRP